MDLNKKRFKSDIVAVILCHENKDEEGCIKALRQLLSHSPNLEQNILVYLKDNNTKSNQLCTIAKALTIVYKYSTDDKTKTEVTDLIIDCYAKAFILCPIKEKHIIAFNFCHFLDNSYYTEYSKSTSITFYCSHIGEYFSNLELVDYKDCELIYKSKAYNTPKGLVSFNEQKTAKLFQWYILCHIINLFEIDKHIIPIDKIEVQTKIDECYTHLCRIEKTKLKKLATKLLSLRINECSDEGLDWVDINDDFWGKQCFMFNDEGGIEFHNIEEEEMMEIQEEFDEYLQSQMASSYDDDDNDYDGYGRYSGSYAQDEMGYSDDDIDTIFDGDPSAYWNID